MKTNMNRILLFTALIGLLLLSACEGPIALPCEAGEGVRVTESRSVSNFSKIILDVPGDVYLTRDNTFSVEITAQQNIIDQIETDISG